MFSTLFSVSEDIPSHLHDLPDCLGFTLESNSALLINLMAQSAPREGHQLLLPLSAQFLQKARSGKTAEGSGSYRAEALLCWPLTYNTLHRAVPHTHLLRGHQGASTPARFPPLPLSPINPDHPASQGGQLGLT
jgi:hypothetical protein